MISMRVVYCVKPNSLILSYQPGGSLPAPIHRRAASRFASGAISSVSSPPPLPTPLPPPPPPPLPPLPSTAAAPSTPAEATNSRSARSGTPCLWPLLSSHELCSATMSARPSSAHTIGQPLWPQ